MTLKYQEPAMPGEAVALKIKLMRDVAMFLEDHGPKFERVGVALRPLARVMPISYLAMDRQLIVRLQVDSMDDVMPILEELSITFGIEFDKSADCYDKSWRQFESRAAPWLRVDAELKGGEGTDACRRVVVGYEQVPIYEIRCGDDANPNPTPQQPDQPTEEDFK